MLQQKVASSTIKWAQFCSTGSLMLEISKNMKRLVYSLHFKEFMCAYNKSYWLLVLLQSTCSIKVILSAHFLTYYARLYIFLPLSRSWWVFVCLWGSSLWFSHRAHKAKCSLSHAAEQRPHHGSAIWFLRSPTDWQTFAYCWKCGLWSSQFYIGVYYWPLHR